ncbi:Formin-like protein 13 [Orobanche minor]
MGSAIGFRLDSLLKLTETRALNNKMTLMHYLCKVLSDKLPELLDFWKDLSSLEPASKIQLKFLAEEMQAINKGLERVMQELSMSESDGPVSDHFRKQYVKTSATENLSISTTTRPLPPPNNIIRKPTKGKRGIRSTKLPWRKNLSHHDLNSIP